MAMMKAQNYEPKRFKLPCYMMPKLNGLHAAWLGEDLVSFDQKVWQPRCLPHIYRALRKIQKKFNVKLTGEIYRHGWSLQQINSAAAVKRVSAGFNWEKVQFHVFDCILDRPFNERWQMYVRAISWYYAQVGADKSPIQIVSAMPTHSVSHGDLLYKEYVSMGYEGAMYHMDDQTYVWMEGSNYVRSWNLYKRKDFLDAEFRIVDIEIGEKGKAHENRMGGLVCETKTGRRFNVGTGFSFKERDAFWKKPPIGKYLKVKFLVYSDEGIPLNGSSLGIREQK